MLTINIITWVFIHSYVLHDYEISYCMTGTRKTELFSGKYWHLTHKPGLFHSHLQSEKLDASFAYWSLKLPEKRLQQGLSQSLPSSTNRWDERKWPQEAPGEI